MFSSSRDQIHMFGLPRPIMTVDRRYQPNVEIAPNCPRCDSSNTKFCYYNNYSLTQPRYFCKGCRRYWTKGGSLRNVPVGGSCSKNRRSRSRRAAGTCKSNSTSALLPDLALDDMVGGSHQSSAGGGGERIDLGMLYLKFLNPSAVPELAEPVDPTGSDRFGGTVDTDDAAVSYEFDASGFESVLTMPAAEEQEVFPAGLEWQSAELQQGLCPFPEVHMDGCDWSSLDHSSFGAF